jgi:multidrug efflux pump subunit AcrA (membrane-fusion protein)
MATKLMAEVKRLDLEVGQRVAKGQILVVLDDSDIIAMRSEAAAYRAEAQAALGEVDAVQRQAEAGVAQALAAVDQAKVSLADAQRDLDRANLLYKESVIPRSQLDKAQLVVNVAEQNLKRSAAAANQAKASVQQASSRTPQVEAKKEQAIAKEMQAAAMQQYAVLRAPFDGVVTAKYFERGQLSVPGQPIVVVEQSAAPRVAASLPDSLAFRLQLGDQVTVVFETGSERRSLPAKVIVKGGAVDPASRTIPIEVSVPSGQGLSSGQFVRVLIPDHSRRLQLLVPTSAVTTVGEQTYVWRVTSDDVAARTAIELGRKSDEMVAVLRGLSPGDTVIVNPPQDMYDGARVTRAAGQ